jgi:DtxR family transcriptional regulator, Mn-dependent transcriptional regulator
MSSRPTDLSPALQDYAKAIYVLEQRSGRVSTTALAERLGVTPASVSGMIRTLVERELVRHEPYHGITLTKKGVAVALEVIRHHRLLELFLAESLGVPWDRVHEEAEVLEHALSEELEARIAARLGYPTHDPHGDPIPTPDGAIEAPAGLPLAELEPGTGGVFIRVSDEDPALLRLLAEQRISIGDRVELVDKESYSVRVGDTVHVLGAEVATAMRVVAEHA